MCRGPRRDAKAETEEDARAEVEEHLLGVPVWQYWQLSTNFLQVRNLKQRPPNTPGTWKILVMSFRFFVGKNLSFLPCANHVKNLQDLVPWHSWRHSSALFTVDTEETKSSPQAMFTVQNLWSISRWSQLGSGWMFKRSRTCSNCSVLSWSCSYAAWFWRLLADKS